MQRVKIILKVKINEKIYPTRQKKICNKNSLVIREKNTSQINKNNKESRDRPKNVGNFLYKDGN